MSFLPWRRPKDVVRIIRLQGIIQGTSNSSRVINLRRVEKSLDAAFDVKKVKPKAVCLEINSMGGSAVQSNLIFNRIREMAKENEIPVISFAEDAALSGGYWLALAGDEIFIDKNTFIGSIGALAGNIGLVDAMKKLGVERRLITSGKNKVRWDAFQPEKQEDREWMKNLLTQVHTNFIEVVKERRPGIDKEHKTVFTGDFFVGETAVKIGLADGTVHDMKSFCRERFGKNVVFQRCDLPSGLFGKWIKKNVASETSIQIDDALNSIAVSEMQSSFGLL